MQPTDLKRISLPPWEFKGSVVQTGLSILASLQHALGYLDRVARWLRAVGYIQAAPGFHDNAKVLNGFSDLIAEIWSEAGRHARSAPGQGPSPLNVPVIIDAFVAVSA